MKKRKKRLIQWILNKAIRMARKNGIVVGISPDSRLGIEIMELSRSLSLVRRQISDLSYRQEKRN